MTSLKTLPLLSLTAALALAGCNKAPQTTDNAMVNVDQATEANGAAFSDAAPVVENSAADSTAAVSVAAVPKPANGVSATDAAPLVEAGAIEDEIRDGNGIERVRYGDGWAWTCSGAILRTADRDGNNVAYFRGGRDQPFLVQRGQRAYAYQGDKPVRVFDRNGSAQAPDADRTREAEQAANDARNQRQHAQDARDHARGGHGEASPTPSPTASPSPEPRGHDRHGRADASPTPTPAPTDSPSPRWRQPQRTPNRSPDH